MISQLKSWRNLFALEHTVKKSDCPFNSGLEPGWKPESVNINRYAVSFGINTNRIIYSHQLITAIAIPCGRPLLIKQTGADLGVIHNKAEASFHFSENLYRVLRAILRSQAVPPSSEGALPHPQY